MATAAVMLAAVITGPAAADPSTARFTQIAAGGAHTCARADDGVTYCWGSNYLGQLGDGGTTDQTTPTAVHAPAGVALTQVTAGLYHTCGLGDDANAYCWGQNAYGQLGDGSTTSRTSPVAVLPPGGVPLTQITAGEFHTCALDSDGNAYCWGVGLHGQLGDGEAIDRSSPVAVNAPADGVTFTRIAAGGYHTCGLGSDNNAYCWGAGQFGTLGDGGDANQSSPVPVSLPAGVTFTRITGGGYHTCALGSDSKAYCWGVGDTGQLGNGDDTTNHSTPVPVNTPAGVTFTRIAAGDHHTCAVGSDTKAYCWGNNPQGQLGDGGTTNRSSPVPVHAPDGVAFTELAPGYHHTCGLTGTATYCWGWGDRGRLGTGDSTDHPAPARMLFGPAPTGPQPPTAVMALAGHEELVVYWRSPMDQGTGTLTGFTATASPGGRTCATDPDQRTCTITGLTNGTPYTVTVTATSTDGTSAASDPSEPATPTPPPPPTGVTATAHDRRIAVSWTAPTGPGLDFLDGYTATASPGGRTCAAGIRPALTCTVTGLTNGAAYTVTVVTRVHGGTSPASAVAGPVTPVTEQPASPVVQVAAGVTHSCELEAAGRAYCWGDNQTGQLGDGTDTDRPSPTAVNAPAAGVTFTQLAVGGRHTCGLGSDSKAYCWGVGGPLGNGDGENQSSPVPVDAPAAGVTFTQLTAGLAHTCGLGSDAKAYCWGYNGDGRVGDGTNEYRMSPVAVNAAAGVTFTQLAAGLAHTCGLGSDAKAYCWGYGSSGQLGDGGTVKRSSPVAVNAPAGGVTFTQLTAGGSHTCGLGSDTKAYCWGAGDRGQLGDGDSGTYRSGPVAVDAPAGVTFTQLTAGGAHTCGRGSDTKAYCWGSGASGELGDGGTAQQSSPVAVNAPAGVTFVGLSAGGSHECGLGSDAKAYCWGAAVHGQLGNGDVTNQPAPVAVLPPDPPAAGPQPSAGPTTGPQPSPSVPASPQPSPSVPASPQPSPSATTTPQPSASPSIGPQPPTGVTATAGDKAITVSWSSADSGEETPIRYTATASPGGKSCTISSSSSHGGICTINGLTNGTAYTVSVTATSKLGTSPPSSPTGPVTPAAVLPADRPQPPVIRAAQPQSESIAVAWEPAALGAGTLLGYTVTAAATKDPCSSTKTPCIVTSSTRQKGTVQLAAAAPEPATCTTTGADAQACTITGLTNGVSYLISITAHTTAGDSDADTSGPVVTVTPGDRALVRGPRFTTTVTASDPAGISRSYLAGADGAGLPASYTSAGLKTGRDGNRTFTWIVRDALGNQTSASRTVIVDNTRPTVAFGRAPRNGATLSRTTTITATASDRNGIARVQLMVNGKQVAVDTRPAFAFTLRPGRYGKRFTVRIRAYDRAGNLRATSQRTYHR
ncbi:hypothetical protein Acy02nite_56300 [Actinoplanes cyaneus]|uniref:Fibronectin type-III domain-containing protein n=1 Tax=Actinoplanes cyaneus TaxID=52696 RepID=A0A919IL63_9ACTN|nr:fibronectin type III domain-containing protein [Actinoplanes cyaneus]MCW2139956.1 Alpha-tubulin suppressor [Actinoplanes cyaneus]GID67749.1 hypothetical protein Acy02nite_56300 [Actinoplanes cyaneus]